ncbi:MAG TPA: hypothetical protein VFY75_11990 [Solirubrobacterales bacterium]|nr:hypothetical protein [Solirubrobacterales bacterium]
MRGARAVLLSAVAVSAMVVAGIVAAPALALSPSVETLPASSVKETEATLNGKVNPNGLETQYWFEYGTTVSYGSKTAEFSAGSGSSAVEKSQTVSGLTKVTDYHYRIVAKNSSGTSFGADQTFKTVGPPEALTVSVEPHASGEGATLKAWIQPSGQATTYQFEYGTKSGTYTASVPVPAESAGSGFEVAKVSTTATGLTPGTKYFVRATATNASGKADGNELSFWSSNVPGVGSLSSSDVRRSRATLSGLVEPHELNTKYWFEYGTTEAYGSKTTTKEISGETSSAPVTATIKGLNPDTLYYYRLVAENEDGTVTTGSAGFVTLEMSELSVVEGEPLGSSMEALSTNLTIGGRSCEEAEITGFAEENPGASQRVSTFETSCPFGELTVKYKRGINIVEQQALEYATDAGETVVQTTQELHIIGTAYNGLFKLGECEYNLVLSDVVESGAPLEPTLTGKTEKLSGSIVWCPGSESVSGKFAITSEGEPVEANPWP